MGEVISLNKYRKKKEREEKAKLSTANRVKYGRTAEEKELARKRDELARKKLEGHRIERDEE